MNLLGEVEINLDGEKVVLRPTFEALVIVEEKSGKVLSELYEGFLNLKIGIKDITACIYGGMYGANGNRHPKYTFEQIGAKVISQGLGAFSECGFFIAAAYSGKPVSHFKPKTAEENSSQEKKT